MMKDTFFIENDRRDIEEFLEKLMKVEINAKNNLKVIIKLF